MWQVSATSDDDLPPVFSEEEEDMECELESKRERDKEKEVADEQVIGGTEKEGREGETEEDDDTAAQSLL